MSCTCNSNPCCCGVVAASCACPPSPTPPWARPVQSPLTQTLTAAGAVSLTLDTTFLDQTLNDPAAPVAITIADGNYVKQYKTILIAAENLGTTETWELSGNFAGFTSLTFDGDGGSAQLMWDGSGWVFLGGDATKVT